jgi:hypothetical protein
LPGSGLFFALGGAQRAAGRPSRRSPLSARRRGGGASPPREPIRRESYDGQSRAASHALTLRDVYAERGIKPAPPRLPACRDAGGDLADAPSIYQPKRAYSATEPRWRLEAPAARSCSPRRLPPADALLAPRSSALDMKKPPRWAALSSASW